MRQPWQPKPQPRPPNPPSPGPNVSDSPETDRQTQNRCMFVRFHRNGQTEPKNSSSTVRFTRIGHVRTQNGLPYVRISRIGHSAQLKSAYLAYIWQISGFVRSHLAYIWQVTSAKQHFGGTIWWVLTNQPAIHKTDIHPFGLFASEFLQRAHTKLSGHRLRVRTFQAP